MRINGDGDEEARIGRNLCVCSWLSDPTLSDFVTPQLKELQARQRTHTGSPELASPALPLYKLHILLFNSRTLQLTHVVTRRVLPLLAVGCKGEQMENTGTGTISHMRMCRATTRLSTGG